MGRLVMGRLVIGMFIDGMFIDGTFFKQYIWIKYWVIVLQPLCSVWSEEAPCLPGRCHRVGGDVGPLAPPCPTNSQPCSGWDKRDSVSRVRVFHVTMYAYGESITCGRITVCHTRILVFHYDVWYYFTERKKNQQFLPRQYTFTDTA